jgi:putative transposase
MALGLTAESRTNLYARLVEEALDVSLVKDIRDATNGGYPLGSHAFKAEVAKRGHKIEPGRAGRPTKQTPVPDSSDQEIGL